MTDITQRRATFRALHERGCFVAPNPWDRGSAILLEQVGFRALASSSAGFAFTRGLPDSVTALSIVDVLDHLRDLVGGTHVPINADFQNGYADEPERVAENVKRCIATGVAGLSIEDATGTADKPLYELPLAVERIRAARRAIDDSGTGVVLTARAEAHLVGHPEPLAESIHRLVAFADAGADVLFAPGVRDRDAVRAMVDAVAPKPLNVLIGWDGLRVPELAELGVRRVSVGSSLARVALSAFLEAAKRIADTGAFSDFANLQSAKQLSQLFGG
jgi:2-methylisocitrate lyase-like PEP mutase family enzyme